MTEPKGLDSSKEHKTKKKKKKISLKDVDKAFELGENIFNIVTYLKQLIFGVGTISAVAVPSYFAYEYYVNLAEEAKEAKDVAVDKVFTYCFDPQNAKSDFCRAADLGVKAKIIKDIYGRDEVFNENEELNEVQMKINSWCKERVDFILCDLARKGVQMTEILDVYVGNTFKNGVDSSSDNYCRENPGQLECEFVDSSLNKLGELEFEKVDAKLSNLAENNSIFKGQRERMYETCKDPQNDRDKAVCEKVGLGLTTYRMLGIEFGSGVFNVSDDKEGKVRDMKLKVNEYCVQNPDNVACAKGTPAVKKIREMGEFLKDPFERK